MQTGCCRVFVAVPCVSARFRYPALWPFRGRDAALFRGECGDDGVKSKIRYIMNDLFFAAMTLLVAASSLVPSSGSEAQPEALPVHEGSE